MNDTPPPTQSVNLWSTLALIEGCNHRGKSSLDDRPAHYFKIAKSHILGHPSAVRFTIGPAFE